MNLGKKEIIDSLSARVFFSKDLSKSFLKSFFDIIKSNTTKDIKISGFGTFHTHESPERIGRNPKTKEEYVISKRKKLLLKSSKKVKEILN